MYGGDFFVCDLGDVGVLPMFRYDLQRTLVFVVIHRGHRVILTDVAVL